jgi:hypothetical protein
MICESSNQEPTGFHFQSSRSLVAKDSLVAQSDEYSSLCSYTIRTARSRTSVEKVFFLMTQFSQK